MQRNGHRFLYGLCRPWLELQTVEQRLGARGITEGSGGLGQARRLVAVR